MTSIQFDYNALLSLIFISQLSVVFIVESLCQCSVQTTRTGNSNIFNIYF